ncbi:PKD domain-containing protein, partial [candidate division WOR-3 bacterium]|nr:PKD domain-containing protein [candidate division WOR-3 bacterium]
MKKVWVRAFILMAIPIMSVATQVVLGPGSFQRVENFDPSKHLLNPMPETVELIEDEAVPVTWGLKMSAGDRMAVMFTPPDYPFTLLAAAYAPLPWSDDPDNWNAQCYLVFFDGDGTTGPGTELGRGTVAATEAGNWNVFDVSPLAIEITSGSFFFAVENIVDDNPGLMLDGAAPLHHVSCMYSDFGSGNEWVPFDNIDIGLPVMMGDTVDLMLRVIGDIPDPPLTADFQGTPTSGPTGMAVSFTDMSSGNPTEWEWDFGDTRTSTTQNPTHVYDTDGDYTVSLTVRNATEEDTETKVDYIHVGSTAPPDADFSGNPTSGNAPLTVSFTDQSTNNPTSWAWDFGDGNTSAVENPSHVYNNTGQYTVSLTVQNAGGQDTETKTNYITVGSAPTPVTANFAGNPTSGNAPLTVAFTDQSTGNPDSWAWSFGDNQTSTTQSPTHVYNTPGTYDVQLIAIRGIPSASDYDSDTLMRTAYITVTSAPVIVAAFTADPDTGFVPFTHRMTVNFQDASTGTGITTWNWAFGDGSTATTQNPTHTYTSAGTF